VQKKSQSIFKLLLWFLTFCVSMSSKLRNHFLCLTKNRICKTPMFKSPMGLYSIRNHFLIYCHNSLWSLSSLMVLFFNLRVFFHRDSRLTLLIHGSTSLMITMSHNHVPSSHSDLVNWQSKHCCYHLPHLRCLVYFVFARRVTNSHARIGCHGHQF